MNVLWELMIAMLKRHVQIQLEALLVLVKLVILEMALLAQVLSSFIIFFYLFSNFHFSFE